MTAQQASIDTQVTADEIVQRAVDMIPFLKEQAAKAEADRKIPEETVAKMQEAGFFPRVAAETLGWLRNGSPSVLQSSNGYCRRLYVNRMDLRCYCSAQLANCIV